MKHDAKFYMKLFIYTFVLSALTFGGGYVIASLMKKQFVDKLGWINEKEMLDYVSIAQSSPGAIAVNAAALLGYNLSGLPGAITAIIGTVLPPLIILPVLAVGYAAFAGNEIVKNVLLGMQAGICAIIIDTVIGLASSVFKKKNVIQIIMAAAVFGIAAFLNVNVIYIIIVCAVIGLSVTYRTKEGGITK